MPSPAQLGGYPYSFRQYTGDGSAVLFSITFPYISKAHVKVYVNDTLVPTTNYTWPTAGSIQFTTAPVNFATILIRRETPIASLIVTYVNAATLKADNLNTTGLQLLYIEQEALDVTIQSLVGTYDVTMSIPDAVTAGETLFYMASDRFMTLPIGAFGSILATPSAGSAVLVLSLRKNGAPYGTVTLGSAAISTTPVVTSAVTVVPGDLLSVVVTSAPVGVAVGFGLTQKFTLGGA